MRYVLFAVLLGLMLLLLGCESAQQEKVDVITHAAPVACQEDEEEKSGLLYCALDKTLRWGVQKMFEKNPNSFAYIVNVLADDD